MIANHYLLKYICICFDQEDSDMSKEMMDMLSKMNSDEGDATIMPLIHDMMSNLLSKDVLYPSLKDISLKVFQFNVTFHFDFTLA